MQRYFALVHKDANSAYGVSFPDFPHTYAASDKEEDIISAATEALALYAEDAPMPAPSSHGVIMAREDVKQALAEGAFLMQIPVIDNDTAITRANVTFERGLLRAIDTEARVRGLTRSAFLAAAARHEIGLKS